MLLKNVVIECTFNGEYGNKGQLWTEVSNLCSATKFQLTGRLLFGPDGISPKLCSNRFYALMDWVKRRQNMEMMESGKDDAPVATEIRDFLDELLELHNEAKLREEEKGESKTVVNKHNREQASLIRGGSLACRAAIAAAVDEDPNTPLRKKPSKVIDDCSIVDLVSLCKRKMEKAENTPLDIEMDERRLRLEESKFSLEKLERERLLFERTEDRAQAKKDRDQERK